MQIFLTYKTIFKTKDLFVDLPYLIFPHEKFEYKLVSVFSLTVSPTAREQNQIFLCCKRNLDRQ